jgi:hypothetical protein
VSRIVGFNKAGEDRPPAPYIVEHAGQQIPVRCAGTAFMLRNWWIGRGHHDARVIQGPVPEDPDRPWMIGDEIDDPPNPLFYRYRTLLWLQQYAVERGVNGASTMNRTQLAHLFTLLDDRTIHPTTQEQGRAA